MLYPTGDCLNNGTCNNIMGSYWCKCLAGKVGRNCQFSNSVCMTQPCSSGQICIPSASSQQSNHTCLPAAHEFTLTMKTASDSWQDYMRGVMEQSLNEALQNWKLKVCMLWESVYISAILTDMKMMFILV